MAKTRVLEEAKRKIKAKALNAKAVKTTTAKKTRKKIKQLLPGAAKVGRPTIFTPETLEKLRTTAQMDCTFAEMAYFANMSEDALYAEFRRNPDFKKEIDRLRAYPKLLARQNLMKAMKEGDMLTVRWYLEKKGGDEFNPQIKIEHNIPNVDKINAERRKEIQEQFKQNNIIDVVAD